MLGPNRSEDALANTLWAFRIRYPQLTILIVEGDDDVTFFRRHLDETRCHVRAAYGRPRVLGVVERLRLRGISGALAVIDADYDRLLGTVIQDPDIVATETHDMEMTLFRSSALDHLLGELGDANRIRSVGSTHHNGVRGVILDAAEFLGAARLISRKHSWSVQFDGISYERFIDVKTLKVDAESMLRELRGRQARACDGRSMTESAGELFTVERNSGHSLWDLCNGHDVVQILSISLRRLIGTRRVSEVPPGRLELELRLAFDPDEFRASVLHSAFLAWEARNPGFRLLK